MTDRRSAVFLEEMGVGPQWRLRSRALIAADDAAGMDAASAAAELSAATPAPPAAVTAAVPPAAVRAGMVQPSAAAAHAAPQPPPVPLADAPAASVAPAAAHAETQQPRAEERSAPAPAAPSRVPGTPSIASTGEDMSWFDDAPTPEFKPQRKKVAPPEQPDAAPPARRAPGAAAGHGAPSPMDPLPAHGDSPMDEPPSWFDDDQPVAAPAAGRPAPRPGQASDQEIAAMDWPALQAAVASCTRCARCETRQQAVPGRGDEQATWIALDTAPGQTEDTEGYPFADAAGHLLDNMLKAVGQTTEKGAYLTSLVKCHAPHAPSAEELQACRPYLERELQLTQAKVIVAFGHSTGKGLLGSAARGRIMMNGSVPVVATYHPSDLLKKPEDKAKAWQDLCLAKAAHAGRR